MKKSLFSLALAATLLGCAGPSEPPPTSIKPIDSSVAAVVKMNLKTDPELAVADLDIKVENNLLILRGKVPSQEIHDRAMAIAKKSARIEEIADHIEVEPGENPGLEP